MPFLSTIICANVKYDAKRGARQVLAKEIEERDCRKEKVNPLTIF
jgi:hypothetical protein